MRRKIKFWCIGAILILFIAINLWINNPRALAQEGRSFKEAPDFILPDIYGNTFRLSDFKGKVILIDFWATWCPFCRSSIPILMSLYNDYKDKGFEIVGVALEYDEGKALRRFVEEKKITYYVLMGSEKLAKEYSAYGVPTRLFINRQGKIVKKFVGFQDKEILESALQGLL